MLTTLKRFWPLARQRKGALAAVLLLGLAGSGISLATPLLGKAFVDAVSARRDFGVVPYVAAGLLALAVLDLALATLARRVHTRASSDLLADLRAALFDRCLTAPLDAVEPFRHGDLLTRFGTDVPKVQTLLVDGVLGAVQNTLFLAAAAVITVKLSPVLAAWSFLGLLVALAATAAFRRPVERRTHRVRGAMADLSHFLSERLGALRAIRLHGTEAEEAERLDGASRRLNREVVDFQLLDSFSTGVPGLVLTAALAWIYLCGGRLLESEAVSLGTFVAFVLYQGRLFGPAQGLLGLVRSLQEARVSVARVAEVLGDDARPATAPAPDPHLPPPCGTLELRDVTFAYPWKPPVLSAANLRINTGERVALFGASGAGKSTLIQLFFGLRAPLEGQVRVGGRTPAAARGVVGYAGAEPFLLHATVEENLRYGNPGATWADLERAAALAEADGFIRGLPEGYATVIEGRGLALSDGQRQRLGLARLFLRNPGILVLDEAFSGLDLETEARVRERLWQAFPERTALVVSHRPVGLEEFDRILFLAGGHLTPVAPENLLALLRPGGTHDLETTATWTRGEAHAPHPAH